MSARFLLISPPPHIRRPFSLVATWRHVGLPKRAVSIAGRDFSAALDCHHLPLLVRISRYAFLVCSYTLVLIRPFVLTFAS